MTNPTPTTADELRRLESQLVGGDWHFRMTEVSTVTPDGVHLTPIVQAQDPTAASAIAALRNLLPRLIALAEERERLPEERDASGVNNPTVGDTQSLLEENTGLRQERDLARQELAKIKAEHEKELLDARVALGHLENDVQELERSVKSLVAKVVRQGGNGE